MRFFLRASAIMTSTAIALSATDAFAQIPASHFLVKEMTKRRASARTLRIKTNVQAIKEGKPSGPQFKQTVSVDFATRTLRSRALDASSGMELYSVDRKMEEDAQPELPIPTRILIDQHQVTVMRTLKSAGVPVRSDLELAELPNEETRRAAEVSWLARIRGAYAWVIGKPLKGSTVDPQLWFEKDGFMPWRFIGKSADALVDVRYEGYRYFKDFPYPRTVSLAKVDDGSPESLKKEPAETVYLREELAEIQVNIDISGDFKGAAASGLTELGDSADSGIKELLKQYYGVYR